MSENNKLKQNSAITLIALLITIIVLLILAGVTLSLVMGENGIIAKAKQAKEDYKTAEELELGKLDNLNNNVDSIINNGRANGDNSNSQSNTSINYSTTEAEIGTWVDGSKLYQITFTGTAPTTASSYDSNGDYIVGTISSEATKIIDCRGFYNYASANNIRYLSGSPLEMSSTIGTYAYDRNIYFRNTNNIDSNTKAACPYYITVQYIK